VSATQALNQEASVNGYQWGISLGMGHSEASASVARDNHVSLRHYTEWGSVAFERLGLSRFGDTDQAWAVDAYPRLWSGAYANVRYQIANTPELYPARSWRAELYQNIGGGWELAASHDFLGFGSGVRIHGVSVGKYWGNFFARWRHQQVSSDSSAGSGDRFMVRYYYQGDANHYVELNASNGRSDDFQSSLIQQSRSDSRGVVWYHFVTQDWGFKLSASESNDSSAYNSKARNVGLGLTRRW
jgi:YaiO family outer membrane protein